MRAPHVVSQHVYQEMVARRDEIRETLLPRARDVLEESATEVKANWYDRASYDLALEEVLGLERELQRLHDDLATAVIVERSTATPPTEVAIGATVTLRDLDTGLIAHYDIVESNEFHGNRDLLTAHSPLGRQVLGHRPGDVVEAEVPDGHVRYQIEDVAWTADDSSPRQE